ncbi:hypothetical protein M413DRAFT_282102 [Hebeloma cylindrosporum]|uniref:Uncharacterized protein n=1 Tax=Hebeloma cylindrosporum TaxID=76867 RepID=A0A0C2Y799_HEBCY|nr:hypothetical protein M413DRAFT_282102 [Hebeloma cylindrosporum h7]
MRRYFNTNNTPSDEDIEQLQLFRNRASKKILDLNAEQIELERSILTMCGRIAEVRCLVTKKEFSLDLCHLILSPLRRLPSEILGEIFLACRDAALQDPHTVLRKQPPSVLSQVCRSWRHVAINLPRLWDTFRVDYKPTTTFCPPEPSDYRVSLSRVIDIWSHRSKTLPMNISIYSNHQFSGSRPIHPSIVASLRNLSKRIRKLEIYTGLKSVLDPIFSLPEDEFPALESLQISATEFGIWNSPIIAFGVSPKLRKISLNIRPSHPFRIFLPWPQITHLDMLSAKDPMDLWTWGIMIRSLLYLVEGRVRLTLQARVQDPFRDSLPLVNESTELTLPALNSLTIEFAHRPGSVHVQPFIPPSVRIPALRHFHFSSVPHSMKWSPVFNEMLNPQILGQLESLTLFQVRMGPHRLLHLLRMTPFLEDLKFKDTEWILHDYIYFLDTLSIKGSDANPGESNTTFIAARLRMIGLWVESMSGQLLHSYASLIMARGLQDPENAVHQSAEDFRVLLMLDKNHPELIHEIAPLLVMSGPRGQKLVDVELVEV